MRFLASQTQDKLPYRIPYVNSNDQIFIGMDEFTEEANRLIDFCFGEVLDILTQLSEKKSEYLPELFKLCLSSANALIGVGNLQFKQISSFVNKMFKNADMFLTEHNEKPGVQEKLSRNLINRSFDMFKKKKEAA